MSENPAPSTRSLNVIAVLLLVITLIGAFFVGHAITGNGSPDRATRGVYTEGSGSVNATPNQVSFTVTVTNNGATTQIATTRTAAGLRAVKAALRRSGVADKDIQTGSIDLEPSYDNNGKINGYTYSGNFNVVVRTLSNASAVIAAASSAAGNSASVSNLSLGIATADMSRYIAQARGKAAADARSAAQALADATGRHLGTAVYIEEISANPTPDPIQYDSLKNLSAATAGAATAGVPIAAGTQMVSVSVKVRWTLT